MFLSSVKSAFLLNCVVSICVFTVSDLDIICCVGGVTRSTNEAILLCEGLYCKYSL